MQLSVHNSRALIGAAGAASVALNVIFLVLAVAVFANTAAEPKAMGPEKRLFAFSIFYLFGLFAALVVDRWAI